MPNGFDVLDGPAFFSAEPWQWRGQRSSSIERTAEFVSGTRLFESESQAALQFAAGVATVQSGATDSEYAEVSLIAVPMIADESVGVRLVGRPSDYVGFTTQVVFRRGWLLGFVSISRSDDRVGDTETAIRLAEVLDVKVEEVLAGELGPDPEAGLDLAFPLTPRRQLNSFAFEATIVWDVDGDARAFDISGTFSAPDLMRCEMRSSTGETLRYFSDDTGLATESDGRWRYLATDDPLVELAGSVPWELNLLRSDLPFGRVLGPV